MKNLAPPPLGAKVSLHGKSSAPPPLAAKVPASAATVLARAAKLLIALAALAFFAAASAGPQSPALQRNNSERELLDLLNHERVANNLPELRWDDALFKAARQHALRMVDINLFAHQLPGEPSLEERVTAVGARFSYIAENIAVGKDSRAIHSAWMDSPGHRANILSNRASAVGIAVVRGTGGLFAVEDFSQSVTDMSLEQQEKQVASLLTAKGLRVTGSADDARKACDGKAEMKGMGSLSIVRFDTTDLSAIAPELESKIRKEPYGNVTVGACRTSEAPGFARYRIVLVFF